MPEERDDTTTDLTEVESTELAEAEQVIERGIKTFTEVGNALLKIRDGRLYRAEFSTFEDYCRERWGFSDSRARQLIGAAQTVTNVTAAGLPAPANEGQARALTAIPEPERAEVWRETVERTGGRPTAAAIRETYRRDPEPEPEAAVATDEPPIPVREVIPADDEQEIVRRANEIKRRQKEERQREQQAALDAAYAEAVKLPSVADLRTGDFREVLADLDGTVDAIITDPPYPAEYLPLYGIRDGHDETDGLTEFREDGLAEIANRLLKPGGICAVMVGQSYLPEILERMTDGGGLTYHWTLAYLTPGGQAVQLWQRKVNTFWKPILVFTKGEYTGAWFGDVAKSDVNDNDKRFHEWGQSESGMVDLIERLTKPGDLIVDPFLGAGTTGVAALATGRQFIGCDIDADHVAKADARIRMAAA
jgi:site-specific DNA-methyltransferase (adenine-specific)